MPGLHLGHGSEAAHLNGHLGPHNKQAPPLDVKSVISDSYIWLVLLNPTKPGHS